MGRRLHALSRVASLHFFFTPCHVILVLYCAAAMSWPVLHSASLNGSLGRAGVQNITRATLAAFKILVTRVSISVIRSSCCSRRRRKAVRCRDRLQSCCSRA